MSIELKNVSKTFAARLAVMVESHLIWHKHYMPWADHLIEVLEKPPLWLIELSAASSRDVAVRGLQGFAYSKPFEGIPGFDASDYHVACLFLRYSHKDITWETFLNEAGKRMDAMPGRKDCEYFYDLLNRFEGSNSLDALNRQANEVRAEFADLILLAQQDYDSLKGFQGKELV